MKSSMIIVSYSFEDTSLPFLSSECILSTVPESGSGMILPDPGQVRP